MEVTRVHGFAFPSVVPSVHVYTPVLVTVSARSANDLPITDRIGELDRSAVVETSGVVHGSRLVDMRSGSPVRAGTFAYEGNELVTPWHAHDLHQIEYAFQGTVEVETRAGHYLLPPQQAAWIPAGLVHQTTIRSTVRTVSVFFHPDLVPEAGDSARILAAAPVIREMILYGVRWPIDRTSSDPMADRFFATLGRPGRRRARPGDAALPSHLLRTADRRGHGLHRSPPRPGDRSPGVPIGRALRTDAAPSVRRGHRNDVAELRAAGAVPSSDGPAGRTGAECAGGGDGGRFRERERLLAWFCPPDRREPDCLSATGDWHRVTDTGVTDTGVTDTGVTDTG